MQTHATSIRSTGTQAPLARGSFVFFERGAARFCAPVDDIQAIAEIGEVHALPFRRKGIAGVFMFRGRVALLCDPGAVLALAQGEQSQSPILAIVVAFPEGTVAFRVDRVSEIVPGASLQRPAGERNALTEWMDGYAMQGAAIAFLTTFDKLMRLLFDAGAGGLASLLKSASVPAGGQSLRAIPSTPPAQTAADSQPAKAKEIAPPKDAPPAEKSGGSSAQRMTPQVLPPVRSATGPARSTTIKPRPVRTRPARPLSYAHRKATPPVEPPEAETRELLPMEPEPVLEPSSIEPRQEERAREHSTPSQGTASVTPAPGFSPVLDTGRPAAPQPTSVSVQPALVPRTELPGARPSAPAEDRPAPARRPFPFALAAGVVLALAAAALLLPDWGVGTRRAEVAPAPAAPKPIAAVSPERPADITIVGKDFELRVERGVTNEQLAPPTASPAETSPAAIRPGEIRHTVVRGDTLWAIATRYLGNPYRYPELAQNSRIRNPDLIHPGDVVIIVRRR